MVKRRLNNDRKRKPPIVRDFSASRKHSMDYVTVDGVILRTGYSNKRDWYLVCIRELLDNAADFLWEFCKGADDAVIMVEIFKDDTLFRLKVRNSNSNNIPVFSDSNIAAIFDYEGRYGSKQDVHVVSRGMLGDALKQILAFGYVLQHSSDDGTEFIDKQWNQPLIIRHNKVERRYILEVDKVNQRIEARQIKKRRLRAIGKDTEVELVLPVIDEVRYSLDRLCIEEFCRKYPIFTTDISFKISITDNSNSNSSGRALETSYNMGNTESHLENNNKKSDNEIMIAKGLLEAISKGPPKARISIDFPAIHPITTELWNKADSIHSYKAEEFSRRLLNVQERWKTGYDILRRYREGTNIKRTKDNELSVEGLVSLPKDELSKKMKNYYDQLKSALPPPTKISLPHRANRKQRMNTLKARVATLYDIDHNKDAIYKVLDGQFSNGVIQYPFLFEIFAIPFKRPDKAKTIFIGAVNYSISPKENGNLFEGEYLWRDERFGYHEAKDILGVLQEHKFYLLHDQGKLPCLVIANLVTPRRDPHGQDKSRIDTEPFVATIIEAVRKMASGIQTYHAAGWKFRDAFDRSSVKKHHINWGKKTKIEDLLKNFLVEHRGLPIS
ncbi:MAG TPA: hypothetical protein VH500_10645 [Nitrososphaeraceae archaeon]